MIIRLLKKDLRRNKTLNMILFLFVVIASIAFASGIYNLISVLNGTDYQFGKAGVGDYQIISRGENVIGANEEKIKAIPAVRSYRKDTVIYCPKGDIKTTDGKVCSIINAGLMNSIDRLGIKLFDKDDNEITSVSEDRIIVSGKFLRDNDLNVGDKIVIEKGEVKSTFEIEGSLKDAFLGSEFMGNPRFLMNEEDFREFYNDEESFRYYGGEIFYIDTDDEAALGAAAGDLYGISYSYPISQMKMAYVMNLIVGFVVVVMSVCLMIVSFLVLRFTINFSIDEDFREIGVMKAIGIRNGRIRRLYLSKYAVIAIAGSVIGFFASIPFGEILLKSMTKDMILGAGLGYFWNTLGSLTVVITVILFAYLSTRKVNKLTPVDAVRSGQTGERFRKKSGIRMTRNKFRPSWYLALNDCLSSPKRFLTIIITFTLTTLLVLMIVNTANTMNSDKLLYLFGPEADVYITDNNDVMKYMHGERSELEEHVNDIARKFTQEGMPCTARLGLQYKYAIEFEGQEYTYFAQQDINTRASEFKYSEGTAPSNAREIAITDQFSDLCGAAIGDSVKIDFGEGPKEMLITGRFQSLNNLGRLVLFHEDAPTRLENIATPMQYKLTFTDSPDQKTIDERVGKIKDLTGNDEVFNATEYCVDSVKAYEIMDAVAKLLLIIVLIVVILVTVLMERSFIADEKSEIAIVKAVGFKDRTVMSWHIKRFFIVGLIAMLLAVGLSIPMTNLVISPIFGMMGASDIDYNYDIINCFVVYPVIILLVTVVTAYITSLYTKKIVCRDTASIE